MKQEETPRSSTHSEELFRLVAENVEEFAIFAVDLDGRLASWNPGVEKLLGYAEDEWVGRDTCIIFTPEDNERDACGRELREAAEQGRAEDRRWHVRKDGTRFWANGLMTALRDDAGALRGFAKIMRDETERRLAEEDARRTKARLDSALKAGLAGTFYWDIPRDRIVTDENMRRYFSLRPEATREGVPLAEVLPAVYGEDRQTVTRALAEAVESSGSYSIEYRVRHGDGVVRWLSARGEVERDDAGKVTGLPGFAVDVTERKEAERLLRESEARYRTLFDSIDEGFCVIEVLFDEGGKAVDYRFLEINPAFERHTGLADAQGRRVRELAPSHEEHWFEVYGRVARTGTPARFENEAKALNRWFDVYAFRVGGPESRRVAVLFNDVTERRRAEAALREAVAKAERSRAQIEAVFQAVTDGIMVCDMAGNFLFANEAEARITGYASAEELRRDLAYFAEVFELSHPDGRALPVEEWPISKVLRGESVAYWELRGRRRDTGQEWYFSFSGEPVRDERGRQVLAVVVTRDITARKRAHEERERLLLEAQEANRLKDDFLATVSHELRTPLTSILGWARLLQAGDFDDEARVRALGTIERNARAQTQLIDDLLDVSRIITGKLRLDVRRVDPASFIEPAVEALGPAAEAKGVRVQKVLDTGMVYVAGDPARLQQVVWNLLSNAVKFTPQGGTVEVRLGRVGSHVEIAVSDTGAGIAPEFLPHVFERFRQADQKTTRRHGGLGLGLSIVRHLVELHGGTVGAESQGEGRGATFTVRLPVTPVYRKDEAGQRVHTAAGDAFTDLGCPERLDGLKVLVVDDEADTRELLRVGLRQCGAEVLTAGSAREALEAFEREQPGLVVSDIGMPDEDGYELMRRVRELPARLGGDVPAIALTAYARTEDRLRALRAGYQMHVAKPVELTELVAVIASLVRRGGRAD